MRFQTIFGAALAASVVNAQNLSAALASNPQLSSLATLLGSNSALLSSLGNATNITLLAPSNQALAAFLNSTAAATANIQALLQYHVLNGTYYASNGTNTSAFIHTFLTNSTLSKVTGGQVVNLVETNGNVTFFSGLKNNVTVSQANVNFTGGVIHVVNGLLTIPRNITATAVAANLTSLAGAVQQLNYTSVVDNLQDVTVFAPSNSAFQAIGSALTNVSATQLAGILSYHIVNGTVDYSSLLHNTTLTTLAGANITISVINGSYFVNSARVINPDVLVSSGVVHVIDAVLNPNNTAATANATVSTASPAFSGASSVTNVPFTSGVATPTNTVAAAGSATTKAASSSSKAAAAMPFATGAMGAAALFGGAAMFVNL